MHNVKTIEKLLKDELSATETYQDALEKFKVSGGQFMSNSIKPILGSHKAAATSLEAQIVKMGGTPQKGSGAWAVGLNWSSKVRACWVNNRP